MRTLAWIGLGWLGITFSSACDARLGPAHVQPDLSVIVVAFVAMRREVLGVACTALLLGYLVGRQALAPTGLHECALTLVAVVVYLAAGNIGSGGALFFGVACGAAVMAYDALVFALLLWQRGSAGFSSWATASLLPTALYTLVVAVLCYPLLGAIERRLTQDKREGLTWR